MIPRGLYPIVDLHSDENPLPFIESLFQLGIGVLQLRDKSPGFERLQFFGPAIFKLRGTAEIKIIINDSCEHAAQLGADGVHLGQSDRSVVEARELLGKGSIIGLSTHTVDQVQQACSEADYLGFGPIFESQTKSGHAALTGIAELRSAVLETPRPIVAIGGIDWANLSDVLATGCHAAAMISGLKRAYRDGTLKQKFLREKS